MPTGTGLPKVGEVWEWRRREKIADPSSPLLTTRFRVVERTRGEYWGLRVNILDQTPEDKLYRPNPRLWVDAAYYHSRGEYRFVSAP